MGAGKQPDRNGVDVQSKVVNEGVMVTLVPLDTLVHSVVCLIQIVNTNPQIANPSQKP
jgi:hypothetical protein